MLILQQLSQTADYSDSDFLLFAALLLLLLFFLGRVNPALDQVAVSTQQT